MPGAVGDGPGIFGTFVAAIAGRSPETPTPKAKEEAIRKFTVSLVGAATLVAAGLALLRQGTSRAVPAEATPSEVPPEETVPSQIRLEKLRELGI